MADYIITVEPRTMAKRIEALMEESQITKQSELAKRSGAPQSNLSYMLGGKRERYLFGNIDKVAKYFNVNTDWLAGKPWSRRERKTAEGVSLPANNLFRQYADKETPEQPKSKVSAVELLLAQTKLLKSIDEKLKKLLEEDL